MELLLAVGAVAGETSGGEDLGTGGADMAEGAEVPPEAEDPHQVVSLGPAAAPAAC